MKSIRRAPRGANGLLNRAVVGVSDRRVGQIHRGFPGRNLTTETLRRVEPPVKKESSKTRFIVENRKKKLALLLVTKDRLVGDCVHPDFDRGAARVGVAFRSTGNGVTRKLVGAGARSSGSQSRARG